MKLNKIALLSFVVFVLTGIGLMQITAQEDTGGACPAVVEVALAAIGEDCAGLGRNEACYGYNRVDVTFWEGSEDTPFNKPADRAPLLDLQTIATAPLNLDDGLWGIAVLNVQANIPNTLPGQAVTFLLMGDAILENEVHPDDVAVAVEPVAATTTSSVNLRSLPTTTANVVGALGAGAAIELVGINDVGDWYELTLDDGGSAWIWGDLVTVDDVPTLPITYGESAAPRYGPMQAFYFSVGVGESACNEAPNSLVIRNPEGTAVNLRINDMTITLGSTAVISIHTLPDTNQQVMVIVLIEGQVSAQLDQAGAEFDLELHDNGEYIALTLNEAGLIDQTSQEIALSDYGDLLATITTTVENSCDYANTINTTEQQDCNVTLVQSDAEAVLSTPPDVPAEDALTGIGAGDACMVAAFNTANLRSGPSTTYSRTGSLQAGLPVKPVGQATGTDGYRWWTFMDGSWIRSDLVATAGNCNAVPAAAIPEPPVHDDNPPPPSGAPPSGVDFRYYEINGCSLFDTIVAGQTLAFQDGIGRWPTVEETQAKLAGHYAVITIDGTPLSVYYEGITSHGPDGFGDRARANWVATSGTHTVSGYWTSHGGTDTCVFTVP